MHETSIMLEESSTNKRDNANETLVRPVDRIVKFLLVMHEDVSQHKTEKVALPARMFPALFIIYFFHQTWLHLYCGMKSYLT